MNEKSKTKIILLCVGLFLLFLVLRFPYQNLRGSVFSRVYKATGIQISAEELYPVFLGWPGVSLRKVDLAFPLGASELNLSADKVIARVSPAGLFPPYPAISMKVKSLKKGGNLYLKFSQGKTYLSADVEADSVNLEQIQFAAVPGTFQGILDAEGELLAQLSDLAKSTGGIELKVQKLKLPTQTIPMSPTYSFSIPSMTVNNLTARITIKNGVAEFNEFKFGTPETDISGGLTGEVRLGQTMDRSAINLTLHLRLANAYQSNPQSATLVSFLKTYRNEKTGEYGLRCSATIQEITTQYRCAIPEKVE